MKIEVTVSWYDRFQTEENKIRFDTITIRVPKDVKVLCKETIIKLLRERENRIHDINQHIWKKNQRTRDRHSLKTNPIHQNNQKILKKNLKNQVQNQMLKIFLK